MKTLTYSITINKPQDQVFNKILDKSSYSKWTKAWGPEMTYEGEWKEGEHVSFLDKTEGSPSEGGTKVIIEKFTPHEHIRAKHIAMVDRENNEIEPTDDMMKKWIGSLEEYYFKKIDDNTTEVQVVMSTDPAFQEMFDETWPKALKYFKEVCES